MYFFWAISYGDVRWAFEPCWILSIRMNNSFQFLEHSKSTHALGRVGESSEVAKAIAFLASGDSSFTTGELLRVDGGRGIMTPR